MYLYANSSLLQASAVTDISFYCIYNALKRRLLTNRGQKEQHFISLSESGTLSL